MSATSRPIEEYPHAKDLPAPPPAPEQAAEAAASAPRKPLEVAALEFLDADAVRASMQLAHPFRWDGREVRSIEVRRVSALAIAEALPEFQAQDDFAIYAVMTGLPAPVLRGLLREDREALMAIAGPLLRQETDGASSAPISPSGGVTS